MVILNKFLKQPIGQNKQIIIVKIQFIQKSSASSMDLINTPTPRSKYQVPRLDRQRDRAKRFMRKPAAEKTQRSSSKKSFDSSMKQMYIKSPTSITKQKNKQPDFFAVLAESMISKVASTQAKNKDINQVKYRQRSSQRYDIQGEDNQYKRFQQQFRYEQQERTQKKNYETKLKTLQAEIDLKNHEISILSGQIQRIKVNFEQQKQKRKKLDIERKQISKQMRQLSKVNENMKIDIRKYQKQKEHLMKQIEFLQRINFDEKTRSLQSYRQKYLEQELEKAKKQIHKSKSQRQQELQHHIHTLKQQKFTIQSHYKAMKVANQCLIKQLNNTQESIHDIILNSEQYKKLRDKYVRFLEEYKLLRNQYWSLKAESSHKNQANDSSSLFSITASEVEDDLSLLKNESSFSVLDQAKPPKPQKTKSKYEKVKGFPADATYSFNKAN